MLPSTEAYHYIKEQNAPHEKLFEGSKLTSGDQLRDLTSQVKDAPKISPDLIYVDASHEYECVYQDISLYWKLLRNGGILLGDDYCKWQPGVVKAVEEFSKEIKKPIQTHTATNKWWIIKN